MARHALWRIHRLEQRKKALQENWNEENAKDYALLLKMHEALLKLEEIQEML